MNRWLIPAGSLAAIVAVAFVALFAAGVFDGDSTSADRDGAESDLARCAEDAEDCDDTSGGDALGVCVSEDDPLYDPDIPCQDTVANGDGGDDDDKDEAPPGDGLNICIAPDDPAYDPDEPCSDTPADGGGGDDPANGGDSLNVCIEGVSDCGDMVVADPAFTDGSEDLAVEAAFAKLAEMGEDTSGVEVSGVRPVEWGNACLGVDNPDLVCAEVITPGFIIALSGSGDWVFHTDTNGNAVFVPQD
jgi:hypothetical protein